MYNNPFVYKRPLYPGRDDLVAIERRVLLEKAVTSLKFGQWLSVCCAKKTGKTSFLLRLIHESGERHPDWRFTLVRAEDFLKFTLDELQRVLLVKLLAEITASSTQAAASDSSQFENGTLQHTLSRIGKNLTDDEKIIIIFDGLENAPRDFIQTVLRELINLFQAQDTDKTLTKFQFIAAGCLPPNELCLDTGLSFSEYATKTFLEDFLFEDVENMINKAAGHLELPCQNGFTRLLYEMTSGTGYLIQKICYKILETAFLRKVPPEFTLKSGEEAIHSIIRESETNVEMIIQQVEKKKSLIEGLIRTLRNGAISSYKFDPDLQTLVSIGALSHRDGTYRLRNQIFEKIFRDFFTAERLANRYYAQKNYHRAKELFFDAIAQQDNAKSALDNLLISIKAIAENANHPDFVTKILQVFVDSVEGVQNCSIFLLDKHDNKMKIAEALGLSSDIVANFDLNYGEGVAGSVAQTGRARVIRDVTDEVECPEFVAREIAQKLNIGAMISLPLQIGGEVLGVINLCLRKPHEFTHSEIKMLEIMSAQVCIALQNRPLYQSLERHEDYFLALNNTVQSLEAHIDSEFVFEQILETTRLITGYEKMYIVWKDVRSNSWQFVFPRNLAQKNHNLRTPDVIHGEGAAGIVLKTGKPYIVSDVQNDEQYFAIWEEVRFEYAIPLMSDGEIVGCLSIAGPDSPVFSQTQQTIFSILSTLTGLAIKKQRLYGVAEKQTQQVIDLTRTQLKLSNALEAVAIEEAIAGLVHDIKNISTQIAGETQWLHKCEKENKIEFKHVESAIQNINSYIKNVEDLTDSVRNRAYKLPPELKLNNMKEVVEEACDLVSVKALRSKVDIIRVAQNFNIQLHVDAGRLARAFFNIMTNAIDAMPGGGTLNIQARKTDAYLEINFSDTGKGIPPEDLNRVLSPFITSKEEGYGLGLAITKHIVEVDHKGKLKLESIPGHGTTVRVRIPKNTNQNENSRYKTISPAKQRVNKGRKTKKHTLVVNDEKGMLEKIKKNLQNAGYKVTGTEYGKKAVDLCKRNEFDAIILDYHLKKDESPTCTALDFLPEIRKVLPTTPIILTSASLKKNPSDDNQYDYFLEINTLFWEEIVHLVGRCLLEPAEYDGLSLSQPINDSVDL
ncbi:MAG: GAF domain-containing protein [bacterium]